MTSYSLYWQFRWLRDQITDLTSEQMCVKYLQLLRRTVWPDGELFEGGRPVKTDRQKAATKEQARRCLAQFFPGSIFKGLQIYNSRPLFV